MVRQKKKRPLDVAKALVKKRQRRRRRGGGGRKSRDLGGRVGLTTAVIFPELTANGGISTCGLVATASERQRKQPSVSFTIR